MSTSTSELLSPAPMETSAAKATPRIIRRRAGVACVHCRKRKVRCDVSQRGAPCAICYLDNLDCHVVPRVNRRNHVPRREVEEEPRARRQMASAGHIQSPPTTEPTEDGVVTPSDLLPSEHYDGGMSAGDDFDEDAFRRALSQEDPCDFRSPPAHIHTSFNDTEGPQSRQDGLGQLPDGPVPLPTHACGLSSRHPPDVLYTHYPFLRLGSLSELSARDMNVLEAESCLRLPTRLALEQFLKQYFRHVHPLLPLVHEGEFWIRYARKDAGEASGGGISLLLLQAMLFAACNFVSVDIIRSCGLGSMREARAELYRRAKLLHDFDAESSPIILAQSALLLSFWMPPEDPRGRRPNTSWLSAAIRHARDAGAHRYSSPSLAKKTVPRGRQSHQNNLKRLWWCCIIRDRVISLGLRRATQITRQTFDFDANPSLEAADLADEVHRSRVYDVETKKALAQLAVRFVRLCVILTDLLSLTPYPEDGDDWSLERGGRAEQSSVSELGWELTTWYTDMRREFPSSDERPRQTDTVRFFCRTVLLYYYASVASLSQYKMLRDAVSPVLGRDVGGAYTELQAAISGFSDCVQQLVDMRLAHCLPISISAFSVLPLLMHASTLQSDSPSAPGCREERLEKRQKQHDTLTEAMRVVGLQYGGVKWFAVVVRQVGQLARKWAAAGEGRVESPAALLRLVLTADMSLSRADHPYNGTLPPDITEMLEARREVSEKGPGYAAAVNPADVLSWTELDRLLDGELFYFKDGEMAGAVDMGDPDPTLPTWREGEAPEVDVDEMVVDMMDTSPSDSGSDAEGTSLKEIDSVRKNIPKEEGHESLAREEIGPEELSS